MYFTKIQRRITLIICQSPNQQSELLQVHVYIYIYIQHNEYAIILGEFDSSKCLMRAGYIFTMINDIASSMLDTKSYSNETLHFSWYT